MTFQITSHNLEYVLDAYSNKKEPKTIIVPYDNFGNELEIIAPKRNDIETELQFYETRKMIKETLPPNYHWHFGLFDTITIINPKSPKWKREIIAPGLAVIHQGTDYQLVFEKDIQTGFNRVVGYHQKDNPYFITYKAA